MIDEVDNKTREQDFSSKCYGKAKYYGNVRLGNGIAVKVVLFIVV